MGLIFLLFVRVFENRLKQTFAGGNVPILPQEIQVEFMK